MKIYTRLLVTVLFLLIARPGSAQDSFPKSEIFGGFSFVPATPNDFPRGDSAGFQTSMSYNFTRWFGLFGDFAGQYHHEPNLGPNFGNIPTDSSVYQYMVGPRFTKRTERVNVLFHAM